MKHLRSIGLDEVSRGGCCVVEAVRGEPSVRLRLLELGLLPGTKVRVVRRAPLGDALEVRVRGYVLTLRRQQAEGVAVRPVEEASMGSAVAWADAAE